MSRTLTRALGQAGRLCHVVNVQAECVSGLEHLHHRTSATSPNGVVRENNQHLQCRRRL